MGKKPACVCRPPASRADLPWTLGIEIVFSREGRAGTRIITMRKTFDTDGTVSTVSRVRDEGVRRASSRDRLMPPSSSLRFVPHRSSSITAADDADGADANSAIRFRQFG